MKTIQRRNSTERHLDPEQNVSFVSYKTDYATHYDQSSKGIVLFERLSKLLPSEGKNPEMILGKSPLGDILLVREQHCLSFNLRSQNASSFHLTLGSSGEAFFFARDSEGKPIDGWDKIIIRDIDSMVATAIRSFQRVKYAPIEKEIKDPENFPNFVYSFSGIADWLSTLLKPPKNEGTGFEPLLMPHAISLVTAIGPPLHAILSIAKPKKFHPYQDPKSLTLPRVIGVGHGIELLPHAFEVIRQLPQGSKIGFEMDFLCKPMQKFLGRFGEASFITQNERYFTMLANYAENLGHTVTWLERPSAHFPPTHIATRAFLYSLYALSFSEASTKTRFLSFFAAKLVTFQETLSRRALSSWRSKIMTRHLLREEWKDSDAVFVGSMHACDISRILPIQPEYMLSGEKKWTLQRDVWNTKLESGLDRLLFLPFFHGVRKVSHWLDQKGIMKKLPDASQVMLGKLPMKNWRLFTLSKEVAFKTYASDELMAEMAPHKIIQRNRGV